MQATPWEQIRKDAETVDGMVNEALNDLSHRSESQLEAAVATIPADVKNKAQAVMDAAPGIVSALVSPDMPVEYRDQYRKALKQVLPKLDPNVNHLILRAMHYQDTLLQDAKQAGENLQSAIEQLPAEQKAAADAIIPALKANSSSDVAGAKLDALLEKHSGNMGKVIAALAAPDQPVGFAAPYLSKLQETLPEQAAALEKIYERSIDMHGGLLPERAASQWQERVAASQPSSGKAIG